MPAPGSWALSGPCCCARALPGTGSLLHPTRPTLSPSSPAPVAGGWAVGPLLPAVQEQPLPTRDARHGLLANVPAPAADGPAAEPGVSGREHGYLLLGFLFSLGTHVAGAAWPARRKRPPSPARPPRCHRTGPGKFLQLSNRDRQAFNPLTPERLEKHHQRRGGDTEVTKAKWSILLTAARPHTLLPGLR